MGGPADRDSRSTGGRSGGGPDESDDPNPTGDEADPFGGRSPRQDGADFDPSGFRDIGDRGQGFGEEEFGFGEEGGDFGRGPNDGPEFDEEAFDSDVDRIDVGIRGLDEMILGGVPERSLMVTIGSAGTGKTTFGLQFLVEALRSGGNAVYITLEESARPSSRRPRRRAGRSGSGARRAASPSSPWTPSRWRTRWRRSGATSRGW